MKISQNYQYLHTYLNLLMRNLERWKGSITQGCNIRHEEEEQGKIIEKTDGDVRGFVVTVQGLLTVKIIVVTLMATIVLTVMIIVTWMEMIASNEYGDAGEEKNLVPRRVTVVVVIHEVVTVWWWRCCSLWWPWSSISVMNITPDKNSCQGRWRCGNSPRSLRPSLPWKQWSSGDGGKQEIINVCRQCGRPRKGEEEGGGGVGAEMGASSLVKVPSGAVIAHYLNLICVLHVKADIFSLPFY